MFIPLNLIKYHREQNLTVNFDRDPDISPIKHDKYMRFWEFVAQNIIQTTKKIPIQSYIQSGDEHNNIQNCFPDFQSAFKSRLAN